MAPSIALGAARAEAVGVAGDGVGVADVVDDAAGERLAGAGAVPGGVEGFGGVGVGVVVEQLVEQRERVGVRLARLPGLGRDREREAGDLAAAEADVGVDVIVGAVERD